MNRTAMLDFEVKNVDAEFDRLTDVVKDWVFSPTNQPWGNRAMLFRDLDGNFVNVFMTAQANLENEFKRELNFPRRR